jgi:hypothetical protein
MNKIWLRRALIVLVLAIPASAYAAHRLQSSGCDCPVCPFGLK